MSEHRAREQGDPGRDVLSALLADAAEEIRVNARIEIGAWDTKPASPEEATALVFAREEAAENRHRLVSVAAWARGVPLPEDAAYGRRRGLPALFGPARLARMRRPSVAPESHLPPALVESRARALALLDRAEDLQRRGVDPCAGHGGEENEAPTRGPAP